jgi:hypothetical protein
MLKYGRRVVFLALQVDPDDHSTGFSFGCFCRNWNDVLFFKSNKKKKNKESAMLSAIKKIFTGINQNSSGNTDVPSDKPSSGPWYGVDLDGTLAVWNETSTLDRIGPPIPAMVDMVCRMVNNGIRVKIFTARACDPAQIPRIRAWMIQNSLPDLEITNVKDFYMERLYDDRAIRVERNTGRIL